MSDFFVCFVVFLKMVSSLFLFFFSTGGDANTGAAASNEQSSGKSKKGCTLL